MKFDSQIENLDVTELEHRLEMALSSPILMSWSGGASADISIDEEGDVEAEIGAEASYRWGS